MTQAAECSLLIFTCAYGVHVYKSALLRFERS